MGVDQLDEPQLLGHRIDLLYAPLLTPIASYNILLLQSLPYQHPPSVCHCKEAKDDTRVGTAARRIVERLYRFPESFIPMIDRLSEFIVPYQHALETEAGKRNVHLYLQGLLSRLPGKNAEDIATLVDVGEKAQVL